MSKDNTLEIIKKEAREWRDQKRREWINGEFEDFGFIEKMQEMFPDDKEIKEERS